MGNFFAVRILSFLNLCNKHRKTFPFLFKWIALPEIENTDEKIFLGGFDSFEEAENAIENWRTNGFKLSEV